MSYNFCGKNISGPFTIPSGIITTKIPTIEKFANEIDEIGIITTKSIGPSPREGNREPIITSPSDESFMNAVGLKNPGADKFSRELSKIEIPGNKFLLGSIFGGNREEFNYVAKTLISNVNGFEINISCPHAEGYGQKIGEDENLVYKIVSDVTSLGKPVFVKVSPNSPNLKSLVKTIEKAGADGITAINTVGPGLHLKDGHPVLTNEVGGLSGKGILPIGVKTVREISNETDLPILGCGGIRTAEDVERYREAGASFFGIGSALAGMTTPDIKRYFSLLLDDLRNDKNQAESLLQEVGMNYDKFRVVRNNRLSSDASVLELNGSYDADPGQFIFLWIPGEGEKPFSVLQNKPLKLFIQDNGELTHQLVEFEEGEEIYIRGPYGISPDVSGNIMLVGGGTGIAALYLFAEQFENVLTLLGSGSENDLPHLEKFAEHGEVFVSTEDGSRGIKGLITDIFDARRSEIESFNSDYILNCGPRKMVESCIRREKEFVEPGRIYSSIEYVTRCGVGLCGNCATPDGYRNCVDGTFFKGEVN